MKSALYLIAAILALGLMEFAKDKFIICLGCIFSMNVKIRKNKKQN